MDRRRVLIGAAGGLALGLAPGGLALAQIPASAPGDRVRGRADAPVTLIEYASVTCGHCAAWHAEVWPEVRRRWIDTGRARLVFRELPTPPIEVAGAGFLLARAAGNRYFDVIDALMGDQAQFLSNPGQTLLGIGLSVGLDQAAVRNAITDAGEISALQARVEAARTAGVRSTPTFSNGAETLSGNQPIEALAALTGLSVGA